MKIRSALFPSLLVAAATVLCTFTSSAAEKWEEWAKLLPEGAILTVQVKSFPELRKDWEKTSIKRFLEDEEVKKWLAPAFKDVGSVDKVFKDEDGMTLKETLECSSGAGMIAVIVKDAATFDKKDDPPFIAFSEVAGVEDKFKASKEKSLEAKKKKKKGGFPDAVLGSADLGGQAVGYIAKNAEADAQWIDCWAIVDGVAVESPNKELLESTLETMKTGGAPNSMSKKLDRVVETAGGVQDISFCLDLEPLIAIGKEAAAAAMAKSQSPVPVDPNSIFDALGINELQAIALTVDMSDEQGSGDFYILHSEKPEGILTTLLRGTSTEVPQPGFIPADADTFSVSRMSLGAVYDSLMKGIEKLGPIAAMATMSIAQQEQALGVTLKGDLFGSLDDVNVDIQVMNGVNKETGMPDISKVTLIKLKDRQRFMAAVDAIKKLAGNGFNMFEETEFAGHAIFAVKPSLTPGAAAAGNQSPFSYAVSDEYVLFGQGGVELMHKVITRLKTPEGASAWEGADAQAAIAALPKDYTGLSVAKGGALVRTLLTTIAQLQTLGTKKGGKGDTKASSKWFDEGATPPDSVFEKYFGTAASGVYSLSEAIHIKYITLPPAGQ